MQKVVSSTVWDQYHLMLGQQVDLLQAMFDDSPPSTCIGRTWVMICMLGVGQPM